MTELRMQINKTHKCKVCGCKKATKLNHYRNIVDGTINSVYTCDECNPLKSFVITTDGIEPKLDGVRTITVYDLTDPRYEHLCTYWETQYNSTESNQDKKLLNELMFVIGEHVCEHGYEEGAITVLKRIIKERDEQSNARVEKAMKILESNVVSKFKKDAESTTVHNHKFDQQYSFAKGYAKALSDLRTELKVTPIKDEKATNND